MATRLYPAAGATDISPAVASGWEASGLVVRENLTITSGSYSDNGTPATVGSGVANDDTVAFQSIYGPIAAQTITGTFKGQIGAREANAATDARMQCTVRVIGSDGSTVRGTLISMSTAALSSEFNIDVAVRLNRNIPLGGSASNSSVSAQAGDYIVIETGFRNHGTNTSAVRMGSVGGTASGDLPVNETTDASGYRLWYEFSQTIAPYTAATATAATATGAALTAKAKVSPTGIVAAATGLANNATVSYLTPPRSIIINGVDVTSIVRLESFSYTEAANRGEVGMGGLRIDDSTAATDIPALKAVQVDEPAAGSSNKRLFTGWTHNRTTQRGPNKVAGQREWDVELVDLNVLFDDYVLTAADSADRPAETDYARMTWLLTTVFGSTGSITAGVVPNSNTVNMEATDYRGQKPRDVAAQCSEAANKLHFIYDYGSGRKLYYDVATGTSLSSTAKISDVAADVDSSTVWGAGTVTLKRSPDRIYSTVHLTYNAGTVSVTNATTASNYRKREVAILDTSIETSALATAKANAYLSGATTELQEISGIVVKMPMANVNDIRAGQRVQIKLTRHGISAYTYFRVISRTVASMTGPGGASDVDYLVTFSLASDVLAAAGSHGGDYVWPNKSNANDDGATVIVDRGGITITNGAITVTNGAAVVIIDGTSNMFKIAATGTQSVTTTTANEIKETSTTLSALGAFAAAPLGVLTHSLSSASTIDQALNFYTGSFGIAANTVDFHELVMGSSLLANITSYPVVHLKCATGTTTRTFYQKYYVLQETAF